MDFLRYELLSFLSCRQYPDRAALLKDDNSKSFVKSKFRFIGLSTNRSALYEKADKWVESIWQNGLIEEVRKLMADYPDSDKLDGFVYKSAVSYINGEVEKSEAISRSKYDIHAYIRRQQTWFKANHEIKWFDISHKNWRSEAENYAY